MECLAHSHICPVPHCQEGVSFGAPRTCGLRMQFCWKQQTRGWLALQFHFRVCWLFQVGFLGELEAKTWERTWLSHLGQYKWGHGEREGCWQGRNAKGGVMLRVARTSIPHSHPWSVMTCPESQQSSWERSHWCPDTVSCRCRWPQMWGGFGASVPLTESSFLAENRISPQCAQRMALWTILENCILAFTGFSSKNCLSILEGNCIPGRLQKSMRGSVVQRQRA